MRKKVVVFIFKLLYSLILSVGTPLLAAYLLHAEGPLLESFIFIGGINCLFLLRTLLKGRGQKLIAAFLLLFYTVFSFFIILYIIVIPYPSYLAWIDLVKTQRPGGIISFLFFMGTMYFSSLFGGLVYKSGFIRPLGGLLIVICFELMVIYQSVLSLLLCTAAVGLEILFFARRPYNLRLKHSLRPLMVLCALVAGSLLISLTSPPNSGYLVNTTLDQKIKRLLLEFFPDLPLLTTVAGYGHFYQSDNIGSKPLLSNTPVFMVNGPKGMSLYLRTQVYDEYTEDNWSLSLDLRKKMRRAGTDILVQKGNSGQSITLDLLFDYFDLLPHTLDSTAVIIENQPDAEIIFGTKDTGFYLNPPLLKGDHLRINLVPKETACLGLTPEAVEFLNNLMGRQVTVQNTPVNQKQQELLPYYLEVPNSTSNRIKILARNLGAGAKNRWEVLRNIRRYLNREFVYSLDTKSPPKGMPFLDDFLFVTKKGFCVHFATAFIILARLNGIPARYTSGFFVYIPQSKSEVIVTGLQAHVWPEVWITGLGWITLEATPAVNPASVYGSEYYRIFNRDNDLLTARQLQALMGQKIPVPHQGQLDMVGDFLFVLPFLAAGVLLFLIIIVVIRLIPLIPRHKYHYRGGKRIMDRRLHALVVRMKKQNIPGPEQAGWVAWGRGLVERFPQFERSIKTLIGMIQNVFYNSREPGGRMFASSRFYQKNCSGK
ncbi:MAG: transglutaminase-like domain-containing protein [Spirochaetia bacterium]